MKVISSPVELQKICLKLSSKKIGLVPTMGALHAGHVSLIKKAVKANDITVVSIFVNPKQFGPNEDYLKYPRPLQADLAICKKNKVSYVFTPKPEDMYTGDYSTFVEVLGLSDNMCGAFRPGHFKGVATVVAKLFNITGADNAYFGMKDFQQLKIIERMARDLNFKTRVVPCPIVREKDGLAMSSRNVYLSKQARAEAVKISASLFKAKTIKNARFIKNEISKIRDSKIDYVEILDAGTLGKVTKSTKEVLAAVAVWVGKTRLIDNITFKV
jgi:pantoate--beta-alanine ligase